jgi:hypothetical protein
MNVRAKDLKVEGEHNVEMKEAGRRAQACVPLATGRGCQISRAPAACPGPTAYPSTPPSAWQARCSASVGTCSRSTRASSSARVIFSDLGESLCPPL